MTSKADITSGATVLYSGLLVFIDQANLWAAEYMPLISVTIGMSGLFLTWWFYRKQNAQGEIRNEIRKRRLQHDLKAEDEVEVERLSNLPESDRKYED